MYWKKLISVALFMLFVGLVFSPNVFATGDLSIELDDLEVELDGDNFFEDPLTGEMVQLFNVAEDGRVEVISEEEYLASLADENIEFFDDQNIIYEEIDNESNLLTLSDPNEFGTQSIVRTVKWYAKPRVYQGKSYNSWRDSGVSTHSGGRLSVSTTRTVSNNYTGALKVPLKTLEATAGFSIGTSFSRTLSYSSIEYKSGKYKLQHRNEYNRYSVKQEQRLGSSTGKLLDTKTVYPRKWNQFNYRVVKF